MKQNYLQKILLTILFCLPIVAFGQTYSPITVTGFNYDGIAESLPASATTSVGLDGGNVLYSVDYATAATLPGGVPNNGTIINGARTYQIEPFNQNNVLRLAAAETGTLQLVSPKAYTHLSLMGFGTNGNKSYTVEVKFTDGTTYTVAGSYFDWWNTTGNVATALGRVNRTNGATDNNNPLTRPNFLKFDIVLSGGNQYKIIDEIVLTGSSDNYTCFFALSGEATPLVTCPADIVVSNDAGTCGAVVNYAAPITAVDEDAQVDILLVASDYSSHINDVQAKLIATGYFASVDIFNSNTATPTLVTLQQYDAVLLWTNVVPLDNIALGNVIAAYIDGGGGVVDMLQTTSGVSIGGTYGTPEYLVINNSPSFTSGVVRTLGTIDIPSHFIMQGIASYNGGSGSYVASAPTLAPDAYIIARYDNNQPFIVGKENVGVLNTRRVSLNFFPASSDVVNGWLTSTDGAKIMANALMWVGGVQLNQTAGLASGTTFPIGLTTNTYEITDIYGTTETCSFTVTVNDTEAPVVTTQDITVQLDENGQAAITPAQVDNGSSDNCAFTLSLDTTTFDCTNIGDNTVTLTATDASGNVTTATAVITVQDVTTPIIVPALTVPVQPVALSALGRTSTYTSINLNGTNSTMAIVAPGTTVTFSYNYTMGYNAGGACSGCYTQHHVGMNGLFTNCHGTSGTNSTSGNVSTNFIAPATPGIYYITQAASWQFGCYNEFNFNDSNAAAAVAVLVVTGGSSVCPADITRNADAGQCGALVSNIGATTIENCSATLTYAITGATIATGTGSLPGTFFNTGTSTVTYTATDTAGNTDTCSFNVTINDANPVVVTQNISVQLDAAGTATITAADIDNGSSDDCGIASMSVDITTFDCTNLGPNMVTLTVTDIFGKVSTGTATVTVEDNMSPVVAVQDITVELSNQTGIATITAAQINNGSFDNCGVQSITVTPDTFDVSHLGDNTVTLTITDNEGNVSTMTATVTVILPAPPTIVCPADIAVNNDAGQCTARVNYTAPGAKKLLLLAAEYPGFAEDVQLKMIATGKFATVDLINTNTTTPTLAVLQNYDAVLAWTDASVQNPVTLGNVLAAYIDAGGAVVDAVFDNASVPIGGAYNSDTYRVLNPAWQTQGTVRTLGTIDIPSHPVMAGVTSFHGGSSSYHSNSTSLATGAYVIARYDNNTPLVLAKENVGLQNVRRVSLNFFPPSGDTPGRPDFWNSSTDGVLIMTNAIEWAVGNNVSDGVITQTAGLPGGSSFPVGTTTNTFTITDIFGQTGTCSFNVTVTDAEMPAVITQNITVQLDATGNVTITPAQVDNGSTDNCGIASMALDVTSFTCANAGPNTVTLTVTDVNGNVATNTAVITVEDTVPPVVVTQDITVQLDATGNVTITPAQVGNGSADACGIASMVLDVTSFTCANVGPNIVILTVTDVNGNTATGTAIVTVEDTVVPAVVTQNITVQLDATGNVTITPAQVDNGSADACGIASMVLDVTSLTCANVGPNTVTLTVTDVNGNVATGTSIVTVEDSIAPTVITQDITVQLDATGNVTITPAQIDNGSSDACGIASMVLDVTSFTCTNVGPNTVTLTVTDVNGNTATGTAIVTVEDTVAPAVVTQDITVQLDATGNVTITPAQVDNGSTDNCAIATMTLDTASFTCANVGPNTVTLTVTDVNGNTATGTAIVTVEDTVAPAVVTQDITVQLDATGNVTITPAQVDNGSADACGIASMVLDVTSFTCTNVGPNTVILTVTDVNGNTATGTAIVTVEDTVAPAVVTQNITVQLDATGNVAITPAQVDNGSSDACGIASMVLDVTSFTCTNVGPNTVILTVTDVNGNTATGTAIVTVEDTVDPAVVTQNITVQLDATGNVAITPAQVDNGSSDACGIASMVLDVTSFTCTNLGPNTVILTVTDVNGNTATGTAIVTVEDTVDPAVVTQNITVQLDATGNVAITPAQVDNGSSDACGIASMVLDVTSFTCANVGPNTVTLTVTDVNGNVATNTAIVTVEDTVAPAVVTQDITVQLDATGNVTITPAQVDNGSADACGIASMVLDVTSLTCANVGPNTVTLTVTDVNGNVATNTAVVTVEDNIAPTVVTQNIIVQLDALGTASITPAQINNGSFDNCTIDTMVLDITSFNCSNLGDNTVVLTVTDVNGNTATNTAIVTVQDNIAPIAIAQDITVELDAITGTVTITPVQVDNGSTDNCDFTLSLDVTDFDCSNVGPNNVVLTVTDTSGNITTAGAVVTVEDNTLPTVITQNFNIPLNSNGWILLVPAQVDGGSYDNCGILSMTVEPNLFDCSDLGDHVVTLTVEDVNGNIAQGTATVTVYDMYDPVAIANNITVQLDATGIATITPAQIDGGSNDICGIASMVLSQTTFDCGDLGQNTVTLTVTDTYGNTSTDTAIVTVQDVMPPAVTGQPAIVILDANGQGTLTVADVDAGTADNCGLQSLTINKTNFDCDDLGNNIVTLVAIDINGNVASANINVTVVDNIAPVAVAQDITVSLETNGEVVVTPQMINNGSTDNCGVYSMSLDITTFTCANIGTNTVTLTVRDEAGNEHTATATVTVLPVPVPQTPSVSQEFCAIDEPTLDDIAMSTGFLVWYADDVTTTPLQPFTALVTGTTYYVATKYGNCISDRIAITVIVNNPPAPTGQPIQFFCIEKESTLVDLVTDQQDVIWFTSPVGGIPLSPSTVLEHDNTYYAAYFDENNCESILRLPVRVIIRYCDVTVHNAVSANGDGKNDYFNIEGASSFAGNKLEIFNRWGVGVYEATNYGYQDALFKGYANTGLQASGNGLLPIGTYYYVFTFVNHDGQPVTKTGFLHLTY